MTTDRPRIAIRLSNDALRQVRGGHPWVYDRAIANEDEVGRDARTGDLAVIFDQKRRFTAIGLWDPESPIRIRVLHRGKPRQIDEEFWNERVSDALNVRGPLVADDDNTGFRCLHGENDQFPGLVADLYDTTLVIKIYSGAWQPHVAAVADALITQLELRSRLVECVVVRRSRSVGGESEILVGEKPDGPVLFKENGLEFEADVMTGQKTGHFLDQRDNRAVIGNLSRDAHVLDVFSCTGGFSVAAAAGGAKSVTSVDRSRWALDAARRHFAGNPLASAGVDHHTQTGDAFAVLEAMAEGGKRFDVVVIDPPSFASKRTDIEGAVRAYERLAALGAQVTKPGGVMMQCSCSSRVDAETFEVAVQAGIASVGRQMVDVVRTGHGVDHPIGFVHGAYLKAVRGTIR